MHVDPKFAYNEQLQRIQCILQDIGSLVATPHSSARQAHRDKVRAHNMFSRIPNLQLFFMILKLKGSKVSSFRKWHFFYFIKKILDS